jgi:hypothetical protein
MAKAQFHKNQRVYVKPVGTWALIEAVRPQWAKGLEEPIRIFYDVGLGRDFGADELTGEGVSGAVTSGENWRVVRARNKWQPPEDCSHHPHPGTYPVVITGETDWGGWRVPGAEYDLHPEKIENQAQILVNSLRMLALLRRFCDFIAREDGDVPSELVELTREARDILKLVVSEDDK